MSKVSLKDIQEALKVNVDGKWGPQTRRAAIRAIRSVQIDAGRWSRDRLIVGALQAVCWGLNLEVGPVDGYFGPQTKHAYDAFLHLKRTGNTPENWRDVLPNRKSTSSKKNNWPTQKGVPRFYGAVGQNQKILHLPFPMKIAWNKRQTITKFSVHEKVHSSARRIFHKIKETYSHKELTQHGFNLFGGCLNVRKMRGGSRYSMHSWGIAIDFDPVRNQLRWGRDRAYLDSPECEAFWKIWEKEGWVSLGRTRNFDWMHVQAARV